MPSFLASLLILVSTFILGGKPIDLPPFIPEEVSQRGEMVSDLIKNALTPTPIPEPEAQASDSSSDNDIANSGEDEDELNSPENENQTDSGQGGNSDESEVEKVPAYNNSSENEMPTEVPQEAVDNSPSLDNSESSTPTPTQDPPRRSFEPVEPENPGCGCGSQPGNGNRTKENICVCTI